MKKSTYFQNSFFRVFGGLGDFRVFRFKNFLMPFAFLGFICLIAQPSNSQETVGRKAATKYFKRSPNQDYQGMDQNSPNQDADSSRASEPGFQMLMINIGSYLDSKSYLWTNQNLSQIGRANYGVTYLFDQWHGLDRNIRIEFSEYRLANDSPRKISFLPLITFPRAETQFPLYFGLGVGLGVFFNQISGESDLSLDYQLVTGARFYDVFGSVGFFAELGLKNHLHLLSDGQFNGSALNTGMVFTF